MDPSSKALNLFAATASKVDAQSAIRKAAGETGADFSYLLKTAQRESGLNATAKATTSSATGLFQFTDDTWLRMVNRYGEKYGLSKEATAISITDGKVNVSSEATKAEILALRNDPVASSRMAGELANENAAYLKRGIGREPTSKELYVAHFMGPKGAVDLINAAQNETARKAADLFPSAARANPAIFQEKNGQPRSVAAVYANLTGQHASDVNSSANKPTTSSVLESIQKNAANFAPIPPSSTLKVGAQLSTGMVMTLLDLQQRHLENAEKQQDTASSRVKTTTT